MTRRRLFATLGLISLILLILVVGLFASVGLWLRFGPNAQPQALAALTSDDRVTITDAPHAITFVPTGGPPSIAFVFWQGGRVDARAYAPLLRPLAEDGILVVAPKAFVRAPIVDVGRAFARARADHPTVTTWVLGGHSLGGVSAAILAASNPTSIDGLVLWAAYPASDLSALALPTLFVYGTEDGLATTGDVQAALPLLPVGAQVIAIEGGNHAQFGVYGPQDGDRPATLSADAQIAQVVAATRTFVASLAG